MSPLKSSRRELADRLRALAETAPRLKQHELPPELAGAALKALTAEQVVAVLSDAQVRAALERLRTP